MKTATLSDLPLISSYLHKEPRRLSSYTPGVLFMWRDYFRLAFAEREGTLLLRIAYDGERDTYLFPLGRDPEGALRALAEEARIKREPLCFSVDDGDRDRLLSLFPGATVEADRGEADYLYRTAELATLAGRRFGGPRNHVNRFHRLYPDHTLTPLCEEDVPALLRFLDAFAKSHAERPLFLEEIEMTREVLANYALYGMQGVVLRVGEEIAAFAVGEVIGDMLAVHIEKADTSYAGAYQRIVSGFASQVNSEAVPLLNREDDMNDEGLRRSKLSYHPVAILDKWRVTVSI